MIISASRRTDIPAFYSEWFFNRIKDGFVLVPNPFNAKMISRIPLNPEGVDCIVFWTKNAAPMLDKLDRLKDFKYYFQYTLNPYGKHIETNLAGVSKRIETFKRLSEKIGKEKMVWRYDPIFINKEYSIDFHKEAFARIADELKDHTKRCMLGFIDHYNHIRVELSRFDIKSLRMEDISEMAASFKQTIDHYPIHMDTCTVKVDLSGMGIPNGMCIDKVLTEKIIGYPISAKKDKNQRDVCQCIESIDIGTYESCMHGCIYCYAIKGDSNSVIGNRKIHNKDSAILIGEPEKDAVIKDREVKSIRNDQLSLF